MNSDLSVQLSELENRYAEALTAGKDVKVLSKLWERIKQLRQQIEVSADSNRNQSDNSGTQSFLSN